ncbi:FeoB-associated Cys-rich membrane protein [Ruminococcus flavefaciens]|uniref:FeoB-associated Cys-rich membrane protein n=1 Tax=Ruminococcus flavefaciens TaxID=1265 RepID=UPI0026ECDA99|nr:FeoB-associated Cys-rich membrane protein [Ruminococcus flavefaciens]MDD7515583.1 FeoB-associated Cys-rich membrane protein [Ruminococcus flavefaciens]MDY5692732.1 FeoB-associated Cys-rich membrane protein [Ruminococcus flavefaciens]
MIAWLSANLGSIVVAVILIAVVGLIIFKMVKDKKEGKSSCSHGCQNCAMHGQCHRTENKPSVK